jgi:hypothetical protein
MRFHIAHCAFPKVASGHNQRGLRACVCLSDAIGKRIGNESEMRSAKSVVPWSLRALPKRSAPSTLIVVSHSAFRIPHSAIPNRSVPEVGTAGGTPMCARCTPELSLDIPAPSWDPHLHRRSNFAAICPPEANELLEPLR